MSALRLHVEQRGSGRYVVLVHGWGLDSRVWDTFRGKLADIWRVVTVDLPGYGRSPWNASANSLDPMVEALAEALPKDAVWVGWSLGGLVASHVACRYPERVRGLVLIASAPRFSEAPGWGCGMATPALRAFAKALREDRLATLERFVRLVAQGGAGPGSLSVTLGRDSAMTCRIAAPCSRGSSNSKRPICAVVSCASFVQYCRCWGRPTNCFTTTQGSPPGPFTLPWSRR